MAVHKHTSWGRTRTPKNILSGHRAGINAVGAGKALTSGTSSTYKTENQRYLVIEVVSIGGGSVVVNGMMTAGSGTARAITPQPTINAVGVWVVDINGIDEVSFTVTHNVTLFAACSTF